MFKFETSSTLIKTIITCLKEFVDSIELTITRQEYNFNFR